MFKLFVGYDSRWPLAYAVTVRSFLEQANWQIPVTSIYPLLLPHLQAINYYDRPTIKRAGQMFDPISDAPMATEFAISRFLVPFLAGATGWSMFCDSDFLFRDDPRLLMTQVDDRYAVMCVKHHHEPPEKMKMDGQLQTLYRRKNWSSMMMINNAHQAHKRLTLGDLATRPGRDFHAFHWLKDEEIGELGPEWNWLEGHSDPAIDPKAVHFTRGTPDMLESEKLPFSDEWWNVAKRINLCRDE